MPAVPPASGVGLWILAQQILIGVGMGLSMRIIFTAIDARRPGTQSKTVIKDIIRDDIGFGGLLMTDDLSMKALKGDFSQRARRALSAGCDVILHCNGDMAEMQAVVAGTRTLSGKAKSRADAALARLARVVEPFDAAEARARFDAAFEGRFAA